MSKTSGLGGSVYAGVTPHWAEWDAAVTLVSAGYDPVDVARTLVSTGALSSRRARCSYCRTERVTGQDRCKTCGAPSALDQDTG